MVKGKTMLQMITRNIKWASIPVLLIASLFACCTSSYEPFIDLVICLGAVIVVLRAAWLKEYFWAGGFLSIVVAFGPLSLASKILVLTGGTCTAAVAALFGAFAVLRAQLVSAD